MSDQQTHSASGPGIGLSLAKQLAEMQGGSITAESEVAGRGSTFTVRPAVAATDPPGELPVAAQLHVVSPGRPLRVPAANRVSALVCYGHWDAPC
ncbi:ATP-binding protein [Paraburkholderia sp. ZP32-5]|uniref:ATP-binding protein n=1 Tax=Paraburkholderia sp. ZP32-5 TaxID=2883245 RepID=UPI002DD43C00|nr:ATP-binding protein [Paraburkholderia sp. ZP32-5]